MSGRHPDAMDNDPPPGNARTPGSRGLMLVLILLMLPAAGSLVAGAYQLFPFCCLPLLILGPALLHRGRPGPTDDGEGPDGNGGSPLPDSPPSLPDGGLPLPDAGRAARRYRGEPASPLIGPHTRRPAHPPERRPVPLRHRSVTRVQAL
jgi:hypothetical protein